MTQGELEKLPEKLVQTFSEIEIRIMSDIVRRIKENGFSSASSDWEITRLEQLGKSEKEIKGWIQDALSASDEEIERIFSDEVYEQYMGHARAYKASGMKQLPFDENVPLQRLIEATKEQISGEYENLAGSMGFAIRGPDGRITYSPLLEYYRTTMDAAVIDIQSGAFPYQTVLDRTINQMTTSGLRWIDYDSGARNRVDVAARRAVLTGFRQVQGKINEQVAADLKTDSYEVTYHVGARPSHQPWQGKVWTMAQLQSVCGLGTVTGLHGANCYHDYNAFIPGVSVRTYTDEQLEKMIADENKPKEYLGKKYTTYEAMQHQRQMETVMRKYRQDIKLLQDGGGTEESIILKKAKYQGKLQEYEAFSKKMGLQMQKQRIYQDGLGKRISILDTEEIRKAKEKQELENQKRYAAKVDQWKKETQKPTFISAKTIEEAQKTAEYLGVKYAAYDGLTLDMANELNRALETLPENIRPVFVGDSASLESYRGAKLPRTSNHFYGVHIDVPPEGLLLGRDSSGRMRYDFEVQGQMVGISKKFNSAEKIAKSKVAEQKKYTQKHENRWFFNEDGRSTPYHEMGHVYADAKGVPNDFEKDAERWAKESGCDMLKNKTEAWCEAWGAYHTNNPELPDYIAKYIESATEKPIAKASKSGIIKMNLQVFAYVPKEKLVDYALNSNHPIGKEKAKAFKIALGYTKENSEELRKKILELFREDKMVLKREGDYGKQYEQIMKITGPNGKTANVLTAWIKESETSEPRLTSLYVTEKEGE